MNEYYILFSKIKESSKKLVDDNIDFPTEMEYFLTEQAMLRGASMALRSILKNEAIDNEKLHNNVLKNLNKENKLTQITTKGGLLYINDEMIPLPEADTIARNHGYVYAEQLVHALEEEDKKNNPSKKGVKNGQTDSL